MARATWNGSLAESFYSENQSIYTAESHLEVVHDWVGPDFPFALPFGYSPTMLWILGPFTMLNDRDAFFLWTLLSGLAVTWTAITRPDPWKLVFAVLVFLGPLGIWCLQLGQTSFLSTAGFLFLAGRSDIRRDRLRLYWPEALILWAFTAKPPLAITAGLALLLIHGWRPILVTFGLTFISTAIVTPWMGPG
ncbi:MAG: glycosyltransferase 87 family protein, partial [Gemmataceae bacterium]